MRPSGGLRASCRAFVGPLLLAVYRTRFRRRENVPEDGGFILAGNHVSYLDPALLWVGAPRETHFMAKEELFETPILGWGLPRAVRVPVSRGTADREAIQRRPTCSTHGEPVGIFPRERAGPGAPATSRARRTPESRSSRCAPACPSCRWASSGTERALPRGREAARASRGSRSATASRSTRGVPRAGEEERMQAMTAEIMRRIAAARADAEKE